MKKSPIKYEYPQQSRIPAGLEGWVSKNEAVKINGKIRHCKRVFVEHMEDKTGIIIVKNVQYRVEDKGTYWAISNI